MSTTCPDQRQGGFAIVSAIFILVVLGALAAFIVSISSTQSLTAAQDFQGARAYQMARAGIEWGIARWLDATPSSDANCPTPGSGAGTVLADTLPNLEGFDVEIHTRRDTTAGIKFCTIEATARPTGLTASNVGSAGFIERQLRAVVEGN